MQNELSSSPVMTEINGDLNQVSRHFPYLMQFEFIGTDGTPSFSSEKPMYADIRFYQYFIPPSHSSGEQQWNYYFFQIKSNWKLSPIAKRNLKGENNQYSRIRFSFTNASTTNAKAINANAMNANAAYSNLSVSPPVP